MSKEQQVIGWTMPDLASRVALDLEDGWFVNLGIGLPTLVADFIRKVGKSFCIVRMDFLG